MAGLVPLGVERGELVLEHRGAHHAREDPAQLLHVDRLGQVVGRAQAQRLHRRLQAGVAGDEHHLGVRDELRVVEQVHAAAVGQLQVQQHDVGLLQRHLAPRIAQVVRRGHGEMLGRDEGRHHPGRVCVVDDQGMVHGVLLACYLSVSTGSAFCAASAGNARGVAPRQRHLAFCGGLSMPKAALVRAKPQAWDRNGRAAARPSHAAAKILPRCSTPGSTVQWSLANGVSFQHV